MNLDNDQVYKTELKSESKKKTKMSQSAKVEGNGIFISHRPIQLLNNKLNFCEIEITLKKLEPEKKKV